MSELPRARGGSRGDPAAGTSPLKLGTSRTIPPLHLHRPEAAKFGVHFWDAGVSGSDTCCRAGSATERCWAGDPPRAAELLLAGRGSARGPCRGAAGDRTRRLDPSLPTLCRFTSGPCDFRNAVSERRVLATGLLIEVVDDQELHRRVVTAWGPPLPVHSGEALPAS
jgi:hypothetical protein